jgi:hypothetical protein
MRGAGGEGRGARYRSKVEAPPLDTRHGCACVSIFIRGQTARCAGANEVKHRATSTSTSTTWSTSIERGEVHGPCSLACVLAGPRTIGAALLDRSWGAPGTGATPDRPRAKVE